MDAGACRRRDTATDDPDAPQPADIAAALLGVGRPLLAAWNSSARRSRPAARLSSSSAATTPRSRSRPPTERRASSSTTSRSSAWTPGGSPAAAPWRTPTSPAGHSRRSAGSRTSRGREPAVADARLRPARSLGVPARGLQSRGAGRWCAGLSRATPRLDCRDAPRRRRSRPPEPMIQRPARSTCDRASATDIPLFVRWLTDARTTRAAWPSAARSARRWRNAGSTACSTSTAVTAGSS